MSDREESPDWLREFQVPTRNFVTLSSTSDSSPEASPRASDDSGHVHDEEAETLQEKRDAILIKSREDSPVIKAKKTKSLKPQKDPVTKPKKTKSPKTQNDNGLGEDTLDAHDEEPAEEDTSDKPAEPPVSSRSSSVS